MEKNSLNSEAIPAVVVGLCAHGLAIARDLYRSNIYVIALEANRDLPGVRTSCAEIVFVPDINGDGLLEALVKLAEKKRFNNKPVLFLTNDRMVESLGKKCNHLLRYYRLSWAIVADKILPLLSKKNIEKRALDANLNYPRTVFVPNVNDIDRQLSVLRYPIIFKPVSPLSLFKTLLIESNDSMSSVIERISTSMPVIAQEFVAGDDSNIYFGALLLRSGKVLARFEGRKLCSRPMGHTTIAVPEANDEIHQLTQKFFEGTNLSGPVSLELKRDENRCYWVIEPTVGRTDFWVGLCSANRVNLPLIEYQCVTNNLSPMPKQGRSHLWINGERHPSALAWLLLKQPSSLLRYRFKGVYFDFYDPLPFFYSLISYLTSLPRRGLIKIIRLDKKWRVRLCKR